MNRKLISTAAATALCATLLAAPVAAAGPEKDIADFVAQAMGRNGTPGSFSGPRPGPMPQPNPTPTPTPDPQPTPDPTPPPTPDPGTRELLEQRSGEIVDAINAERGNRGLDKLTVNGDVTALAKSISDAAAASNSLTVDPEFIKAGHGYSLAAYPGLDNPRFAADIVKLWMDNEGQRSILMKPGISEIGVAVSRNDASKYENFISVVVRWT
ncbi:CAP domain-containing protein [Corynebacterium sp. CCM 8835]|uniref:CAP domain-containing protein n=1 Tax=Corynebacterium antarcticum TaxID=2800405 RepID=A0A9Q4CEV7_9CORY|nr:CAP domain-containing protein [Corynebacterium antarcticum]MCL0246506.1 CAP domain-containing protein [Corynebacterium antarcticum]MCX7492647.1 CAP domain-containing protein [Corynebacterium antarcticum]MCX7538862.1 CAP domain-containing protein [Corynebacterium antarcticum]